MSAVRSRRGRHRLLHVLNAAVAMALCVGTWQIDKNFIYTNLLLRTPIPGVDAAEAARVLLGIEVEQGGGAAFAEPAFDSEFAFDTEHPVDPEPMASPTGSAPLFSGQTATVMVPAIAYSWLTVSTTSYCLLALAAGSGIGSGARPGWRRIGITLALLATAALGWEVFRILSQYGMQFPTKTWRLGMAALTALCMLYGIALGKWAIKLTRASAILLIVAGLGSVVALCLGKLCDAIEPQYSSPQFFALVFAVHSIWGWILLITGRRRA